MRNGLVCFTGLCLTWIVSFSLYPQAARAESIVLEVGLLIDGNGAAPLQDAAITIEGDRVKAVGPRTKVAFPQGARVIKADRLTFPGLIDSHVHYKEWQPELYLNLGVTTALALAVNPSNGSWRKRKGSPRARSPGHGFSPRARISTAR